MDNVGIEIRGIKEVNAKLYSYSQQLGDKVVLASLMSGARIVLRKAKQLAPKSSQPKKIKNLGMRPSGNLRKGIVVRKSSIYSARRGGNKIGVYITLRQGKRNGIKDAYYGKFMENGYEVRGKRRTEENTAFRFNRRGRKMFSRAASGGRATLRSGIMVAGRHFMRDAFSQDKMNAVRMIIDSATAGAEIVARRVGLK